MGGLADQITKETNAIRDNIVEELRLLRVMMSRTTLQYTLAHSGNTNVGIPLPTILLGVIKRVLVEQRELRPQAKLTILMECQSPTLETFHPVEDGRQFDI